MATPLEDVATWESAAVPEVVAPEPAGPAGGLPVSPIGERCPSCRARLVPDQRYCLECGERRGDPRLPFMDAVSFMGAAARRREEPPSPPPRRSRLSPNASLIAGVGTLVLAMGVGVLIGRSGGHSEGGASAKPTVQVVKIPASGAVAATASAAPSAKPAKAKAIGRHSGAAGKASAGSAPSTDAASSVLHPTTSEKLPPSTVHVGASGHGAGYKHGKFTGEFFGE